jgi:hypothetical protein
MCRTHGFGGFSQSQPFPLRDTGAQRGREGVVATDIVNLLTAGIYLLKALIELRAACRRKRKKRRR